MTHTSPLPPSGSDPAPAHSISVSAVMFGEAWAAADGSSRIADTDGVLLTLHGSAGEAMATRFQSAESAIELALAIQDRAVYAISNSVGDDGKRIRAMERIAILNAAYAKAGR